MPAATVIVSHDAIVVASEECERAWRWYRLTCSDADVFAHRMWRAVREGEGSDARAYARQVDAANDARRAAWTEYRRTFARLTRLAAEPWA